VADLFAIHVTVRNLI